MIDYSHVIVIGYGVIAREVLSYVYENSKRYRYSVSYIEHEKYPFNGAKKYAKENDINYYEIVDKIELTNFFEKGSVSTKILIISASNNYLFPKQLVKNDNITIVNFHSALLPELPGRNATSWAIYNRLKKTGITWHYVTEQIDAGDIIIQKECEITNKIKAYELVSIQMELAARSFKECYKSILYNTVKTKKQDICKERKIYKSKEIPGNGIFRLEDNVEYIYRLLRAMDYGKNNIFPLPSTVYNGQLIYIKRYKIIEKIEMKENQNRIYLPYGNQKYLMLKYSE